ncbi:hypothetical protein CRUP_020242 [Coryphaenoides rupestris]|nr:hypothetical protein CRUP_020242 [Coryphaenoides rupestris]
MRPYGLRRSIRCPKKYGDGIKERPDMPAVTCDLDTPVPAAQTQPIFPRPAPERFARNAAALPDLEPSLSSPGRAQEESSSSTVTSGGPPPEPMVIHGYTVAEYQCAYHSVVDPLLRAPCGETAAYSLELGRAIKERLFQELAYPTLAVLEQPGGRVAVVERFCVMRSAPRIARKLFCIAVLLTSSSSPPPRDRSLMKLSNSSTEGSRVASGPFGDWLFGSASTRAMSLNVPGTSSLQ